MKKILVLILVFISVNAEAATMTSWTKTSQVVVHDWAGVLVYFEDQSAAASEGCDFKEMALLEPTHYLFDAAYSTILSAVQSKSETRYFVNGCKQFGAKTIPVIARVDIK
ncbi:MAG: hypothetical protein OQK04_15680 [Kangiellaceae bacterium]|nr:hypothetical protein [Kangiellaceae bacterium]MCW9000148.1 hypothetical protein [Kangiellaceae bacterium]